MRFLLIALILSGCASLLDDSDYARLEQSDVSYDCALSRMRIKEAPGPVPTVVEVPSMWINTYAVGQQWVRAEYVSEINTIYIFPTMHHYATDLAVEMTHAIQFQLGEDYGEWEAQKVARWINHCIIFGEM